MNQKKKKIITTIGILLFFLSGGAWYVLCGKELSVQQTKTQPITGVFTEETTAAESTPIPTELLEMIQQEEELVVYVCGAVHCPGVYTLPEGSRLYEAVNMAGGFLAVADSSYHNLARYLEDGERIYILTCEETKELTTQQKAEGEESSKEDLTKSVIDLNTATKEQLATLPGIGESRAESILEYRKKVGAFTAIEEIMNISGIGEAMFAKIKDRIMVK